MHTTQLLDKVHLNYFNIFYQSNAMVYKLNYSSNNRIMDCCCRPQQSIIHEDERPTMGLPKMKFSFRTQQASPNTKFTSTTLYQTTPFRGNYDVKNDKFALGSTVASNDELYQLQKQREYLIQEDRNLDMFYNNAIVPLERQLEYYERQVKVRSIEIMELQQLLAIRMRQRNMMHNPLPFQNINPVQIQPWQPQSMPMYQHIPVNLPPQNIPFVPINTVNQTLSGSNVVPATVRPRQVVQN